MFSRTPTSHELRAVSRGGSDGGRGGTSLPPPPPQRDAGAGSWKLRAMAVSVFAASTVDPLH